MAYAVIVAGVVIVLAAVRAWKSEAFFDYFWRARQSSRFGPKLTREQALIGVRSALALSVAAGAVLVMAGIYSLA